MHGHVFVMILTSRDCVFSTLVFPFEGRFDLDSEVTAGEGFDVDLENIIKYFKYYSNQY